MKKICLFLVLFALSAFAKEVYATFDVQGIRDSKLALSSAGVVEQLFVKVGDRVLKGDKLARLVSDLELADEALSESEVRLAQIALELAQKKYDRYTKIKNALDAERYENIQYELKSTKQSLIKAQNVLQLKRAKLAQKILLAPYDGVITGVHVELGDGVGGVAQALMSLSSFPLGKLVLSFDEAYWNAVKVGQVFVYRIDGLQGEFRGKIAKVYPSANPQNRKIQAEVLIQDIPVGLFGDGKITVD